MSDLDKDFGEVEGDGVDRSFEGRGISALIEMRQAHRRSESEISEKLLKEGNVYLNSLVGGRLVNDVVTDFEEEGGFIKITFFDKTVLKDGKPFSVCDALAAVNVKGVFLEGRLWKAMIKIPLEQFVLFSERSGKGRLGVVIDEIVGAVKSI